MTLCMAFTEDQVYFVMREVRRVLKPGGLHFFTVRSMQDPDFGSGIHLSDSTFEVDGYAVRFFDRPLIQRLTTDDEILQVRELEEGGLPKRLLAVLARTTA